MSMGEVHVKGSASVTQLSTDSPPLAPPASTGAQASIRICGATKIYSRSGQRCDTIKENLLASFAPKTRHDLVVALDDINLEVAPGEALGLIGANGSGKSTLLKLIAGITSPTRGSIEVPGRTVGLIELGAGFHPDLTGEENIRLQGAIYGLNRSEVNQRMESILDFSELAPFRHVPVKHYSSGMFMRLGFSIAIHAEPQVLLVDEVLAVGDEKFQECCIREIHRLLQRGVSLVFVTHYPEHAERLCDRIAWIEKGRLRRLGAASEVLAEYQAELLKSRFIQSSGVLTENQAAQGLAGRFGSGEVQIEAVRILDAEGCPRTNFRRGQSIVLEIDYRAAPEIEAIDCTIPVYTMDVTFLTHWWAERDEALSRPTDGRGKIRIEVPNPPILPGRYGLTISLSPPGRPTEHYDLLYKLYHFTIEPEEDWEPVAPIELLPSLKQLDI
jgi:lipopolysaccharide transport system ATP-binding protein